VLGVLLGLDYRMHVNFCNVDSLLPFRCSAPGGINSSLSLSLSLSLVTGTPVITSIPLPRVRPMVQCIANWLHVRTPVKVFWSLQDIIAAFSDRLTRAIMTVRESLCPESETALQPSELNSRQTIIRLLSKSSAIQTCSLFSNDSQDTCPAPCSRVVLLYFQIT
jgi:hypothetical protein